MWQSLVVAIVLLVFYEIYTSNAGETYREYLAQVLSIAVIGFFLWRVETLQRLDAIIGQPEPEREDYDYLGTLLAERCAATDLYLQPDLTLTSLAQALGTNSTYLGAYFARSGMTYNAYINRLRIEYFERLYAQTVSIGCPVVARQLAEQSGFRNYNTFATAFKQMRGVSVTAWMKLEATQN